MIAEFESRILALIDDMVDHASDDELFAGGYLRGHLTLAVAELEGEASILRKRYMTKVSRSLEKPSARANCRRRIRFWCRKCGTVCTRRRCRNSSALRQSPAFAQPGSISRNYFTAFPFSSFLTHSLLGFSAASVSLSIGNGSLLICDARISAASGAEHSRASPELPAYTGCGKPALLRPAPDVQPERHIRVRWPHNQVRCRPSANDRGLRSARRCGPD